MRLVVSGLALALAIPALAGGAAAQPVSTQPLAAGEVLLELNATGSVTTAADLATLQVEIAAEGATDSAARAAAEARIARATAIARGAGVAAGDIDPSPVSVSRIALEPGMAMTMDSPSELEMAAAVEEAADAVEAAAEVATEAAAAAAEPDMAAASDRPPASARSTLRIAVRDIARLDSLLRQLGEDGFTLPVPTYALANPVAARREARTRAMAAARADAEAYAAALGMRVLRIVRVTERAGVDILGAMMTDNSAMRRAMTGNGANNPEVETMLMFGVDFALAQ